MLVHRRVTPNIKFAGTHLYMCVEGGTVREKCLAQEHNEPAQGSNPDRSIRCPVREPLDQCASTLFSFIL